MSEAKAEKTDRAAAERPASPAPQRPDALAAEGKLSELRSGEASDSGEENNASAQEGLRIMQLPRDINRTACRDMLVAKGEERWGTCKSVRATAPGEGGGGD